MSKLDQLTHDGARKSVKGETSVLPLALEPLVQQIPC